MQLLKFICGLPEAPRFIRAARILNLAHGLLGARVNRIQLVRMRVAVIEHRRVDVGERDAAVCALLAEPVDLLLELLLGLGRGGALPCDCVLGVKHLVIDARERDHDVGRVLRLRAVLDVDEVRGAVFKQVPAAPVRFDHIPCDADGLAQLLARHGLLLGVLAAGNDVKMHVLRLPRDALRADFEIVLDDVMVTPMQRDVEVAVPLRAIEPGLAETRLDHVAEREQRRTIAREVARLVVLRSGQRKPQRRQLVWRPVREMRRVEVRREERDGDVCGLLVVGGLALLAGLLGALVRELVNRVRPALDETNAVELRATGRVAVAVNGRARKRPFPPKLLMLSDVLGLVVGEEPRVREGALHVERLLSEDVAIPPLPEMRAIGARRVEVRGGVLKARHVAALVVDVALSVAVGLALDHARVERHGRLVRLANEAGEVARAGVRGAALGPRVLRRRVGRPKHLLGDVSERRIHAESPRSHPKNARN